MSKRNPAIGRVLWRGDAVCIVAYGALGFLSHNLPFDWAALARNTLPILAVWWAISFFLRTYTQPTWRNLLYTWAIAVSAGVWLRFMLLNQAFDQAFAVFGVVALGATLVLLLLWRGVAKLVWRW